LTGLKYLSNVQKVVIKCTHTTKKNDVFKLKMRIQLMKPNRSERNYFDEKDNIKFEDFI
jgi:hypothetical protein